MSIGILLITHGDIGEALISGAIGILGFAPLQMENLPVSPDDGLEQITAKADKLINKFPASSEILILTDLLGSTPSNVAGALQQPGKINVVAGLNLPMLIKILSHPSLTLQRLTELAIEGGQQGVCEGMAQSVYPMASSGK